MFICFPVLGCFLVLLGPRRLPLGVVEGLVDIGRQRLILRGPAAAAGELQLEDGALRASSWGGGGGLASADILRESAINRT